MAIVDKDGEARKFLGHPTQGVSLSPSEDPLAADDEETALKMLESVNRRMIDILQPVDDLEILIIDGRVWINVDGVCVARLKMAKSINLKVEKHGKTVLTKQFNTP